MNAFIKPGCIFYSLLPILLSYFVQPGFAQTIIKGKVIDSNTGNGLRYVNIGVRNTNAGTISDLEGYFLIELQPEHDSLTFSMVGYHEWSVTSEQLKKHEWVIVKLVPRVYKLDEIMVSGEKLVEKKYGIKRRGIVHFIDGMFEKENSFEIGQLIRVGNKEVQITSVNLYLSSTRTDSATFRINFYAFDEEENTPSRRIVERPILQRHPVSEGWLKFDISSYGVLVSGNIFIAIEFIPSNKEVDRILYEVKLGGFSKSFYRTASLGRWNSPPHHYCLYATALVDKSAPEDMSDEESAPTFNLPSAYTKTQYNIFIRLPENYNTYPSTRYPVVYHLDGNVYFDPISSAVARLSRKNRISQEPIVVGIGYENAYVMDSLRTRDYTTSATLPGNGLSNRGRRDQFYDFIRFELMPRIDSLYRTDTSNQALMGHSLGGFFVLYAMTKDAHNPIFNRYVAASPSIYHDNHLVKDFQAKLKISKRHCKVYMSMGEFEVDDSNRRDFEELSRILNNNGLNTVNFKVYKNLEHMGAAIPAFQDGIEFIMN